MVGGVRCFRGRGLGLNCPSCLLLPAWLEETVRAMTHVINQGMAMYWGTSRWSSVEIMVSWGCGGGPWRRCLDGDGCPCWLKEAYSVARQFNQIPPICEQAEYHMFQREKVEVQLPELSRKIGGCGLGAHPSSSHPAPAHGASVCRYRGHDLVSSGLWDHLGEVRQRDPPLLTGLPEGEPTHSSLDGAGASGA